MLRFKTSREQTEFSSLARHNPSLMQLIERLAAFADFSFRKDTLVTGVFRTKEEQERIYGQGTKRRSPHMLWMAVDIRDWVFSGREKEQLVQFLKRYDSLNRLNCIAAAQSRTVWLHQVGANGMHFHVQYYGPWLVLPAKYYTTTAVV